MWTNSEPWVIFEEQSLKLHAGRHMPKIKVTIRFRESGTAPKSLYLRRLIDGEPYMQRMTCSVNGKEWSTIFPLRTRSTHIRFLIEREEKLSWFNASGYHSSDVTDAEDFHLRIHKPSAWFPCSVAYEVFIDRYARSGATLNVPGWARSRKWGACIDRDGQKNAHDIFGGDLLGIVNYIPYLVDLGVNLIYITPFFSSESAHRYDVTDFDTVDPILGGEDGLIELIQQCHKHDIRVIGDITLNHTSWHHPWFQSAIADVHAAVRERYYFLEDGSYVCWDDLPHLPKLNWDDPTLEADMLRSLTYFIEPKIGLDGWRIDAANMVGKYRDSDATSRIISRVWSECRRVNPDAVVIVEHNHDASGLIHRAKFDGIMNYVSVARPLWAWLADTPRAGFFGLPTNIYGITGEELVNCCRSWEASYGISVLRSSLNVITSHDTPRMNSLWGGHPDRTIAALGYLFAYPGVWLALNKIVFRCVLGWSLARARYRMG
ncbi:alpha-amylase family glycosyl hydrolase, partial [Actinomyces bowdenii]|uniref:alpha-amylase family glycosyl hydrolase n=1 Tax=Actinomyces bowdenii TaxID=131109 RepID=UPI00214C3D1E